MITDYLLFQALSTINIIQLVKLGARRARKSSSWFLSFLSHEHKEAGATEVERIMSFLRQNNVISHKSAISVDHNDMKLRHTN